MVTLRRAAARRFRWPGLAGEASRWKEVWECDSQSLDRRPNLALRRDGQAESGSCLLAPKETRGQPVTDPNAVTRSRLSRIMAAEKEPEVFDDSNKRKNYAAMLVVGT